MENEAQGTFDELVAGISSYERKYLLSKINQNKNQTIPIIQTLRNEDTDSGTLSVKFSKESFLYKFFLWIRTFFDKRSKMDIYNEDLLTSLGRKINRLHPGILEVSNKLLQSLFYEQLKTLKDSADFFKPFFSSVKDNPGKFFVFLSTFISPEISEEINKNADPYTIPFEKELTPDLRANLLKKLDLALKNINSNARNKLYAAVKSIIWLKQFSELPYLHFSAQFTSVISDNYTCPFENARVDYPAFARVLSSPAPIPQEALEALFLYPHRSNEKPIPTDADTEKSIQDLLIRAATSISMIQLFVSNIPLLSLGKIINNDYDWQIETYSGGEEWFVKFKEEYRVFFETRWNNWLRDRKKSQLASILYSEFGVKQFPELPNRPWINLWGGVPFRCEMTAGFLAWYTENQYDEAMYILNIIILEGVFINNENRAQLSEAINQFADVHQNVLGFMYSLSSRGQIGSAFEKLQEEGVRTLRGQAMMEGTILNAETSVRSWGKEFCEACRTIEKIFKGILDEEKSKDFYGLQNLTQIRGHENHEFREKMSACRKSLDTARYILAEIEPLDLPAAGI